MKENKGITLIALIITIIILIILAAITIAISLGNNGILDKAKQAKENTLIAQNEENLALADYNNIIDETVIGTSKGNVTLSSEEYIMFKNFFSKNTDKPIANIMKPNTWLVGTEYNFGDGIFGVRLTGTLNERTRTGIWNFGQNSTVVNYGGAIHGQTGYQFGLSDYYVNTPANYGFGFQITDKTGDEYSNPGDLDLFAGTTTYGNNAKYEIWFIYTKTQSN